MKEKASKSQRNKITPLKKVGIYGGTFDPIHLGHISLALQMLEAHQLDQILFCPTNQSPHKFTPQASKIDRARMVAAAIKSIPQFKLLNFEVKRNAPSYTIDTVRALVEKNRKKVRYFLILGEDCLKDFHLWNGVEELVLLAPPLIGNRQGDSIQKRYKASPLVKEILKKGKTKTSLIEISSTEIRERLKSGLYCGHLMPETVYKYIKQHKLYIKKNEK